MRRRATPELARGATPSVIGEVLKFAAAALVAVAVLAVIAALILRDASEDEAIDQAEQLTEVLARSAIEPALQPGLVTGDGEARARVDRIVRGQVLSEDIVRVKIWTEDGRIVYSDEPRLIGSRYPLGPAELAALRTGNSDAGLSDLSEPENRFDRGHGELLEVYLPIYADGEPLLFETYQRFSSVAASGSQLLDRFAPALIGAAIAIVLLLVPLAWSLARRLQREHADREALLRRALDAQDLERRRIAGDLHDGILQDLSGAAFSMSAAAERLPASDDGTRSMIESAAAACRGAVRTLRSMLVEIYPPRLRESGLETAVEDLLAPLQERGMQTDLQTDPIPDLPDTSEALLFRVAQEALRNVGAHSGAQRVDVRIEATGEAFALSVEDDGVGFSPEEAMARRREGHMGLRLLRDLAADSGGTIEVRSATGQGTTVRVEVPLG
jgi:signal transduction histidine kinase